MNNQQEAVKAALVIANYWETQSFNKDQPAELHEAQGEAYAHKYWEGVMSPSAPLGFPKGAYWLIGGRQSMRTRLANYIPLDQRSDIFVPAGHIMFTVVGNIFSKYINQPGSDLRFQHRPYEWANPKEGGFKSHLIGLEQGFCPSNPKQVYYASSGRYVSANADCVYTFHQEKCLFNDSNWATWCANLNCENYKSKYYPDK